MPYANSLYALKLAHEQKMRAYADSRAQQELERQRFQEEQTGQTFQTLLAMQEKEFERQRAIAEALGKARGRRGEASNAFSENPVLNEAYVTGHEAGKTGAYEATNKERVSEEALSIKYRAELNKQRLKDYQRAANWAALHGIEPPPALEDLTLPEISDQAPIAAKTATLTVPRETIEATLEAEKTGERSVSLPGTGGLSLGRTFSDSATRPSGSGGGRQTKEKTLPDFIGENLRVAMNNPDMATVIEKQFGLNSEQQIRFMSAIFQWRAKAQEMKKSGLFDGPGAGKRLAAFNAEVAQALRRQFPGLHLATHVGAALDDTSSLPDDAPPPF